MNLRSLPFEKVFPLLFCREDKLVSHYGDITVGWRLTLPPVYSIDSEDYDGMMSAIQSAARLLPEWTVMHKQDIYSRRSYSARDASSFLGRAFERHFDGREYLSHSCCLYLTFSCRDNITSKGSDNAIFGIGKTPKLPGQKEFDNAENIASSFIAVLESSGHFSIERLHSDDMYDRTSGLGVVSDYLYLGRRDELSDFKAAPDEVVIGDSHLMCYTISSTAQLPGELQSTGRVEGLSTAHTEVSLSAGAVFGVNLDCEHIVNQYITVIPQAEFLRTLEQKRREMQSLSLGSKDNAVNLQEIDAFQEEVMRSGLSIVKSHINVLAWGREDEREEIRNRLVTAFSRAGIEVVRNCFNVPCLYIAGVPGAASELSYDDYMSMEIGSALCLWPMESYETDLPGGTLRLCDRRRLVPIQVDIHAAARDMGWIANFNSFLFGPTGSGKSFFMNKLIRDTYDAGGDIFIVDVGDSYEGLCSIVHDESGGRDGIYYSYDPEHPFSFNPFRGWRDWGRDDNDGMGFVVSLLKTMWHPVGGWTDSANVLLQKSLSDFLKGWTGKDDPVFDDYCAFLRGTLIPTMEKREYKDGDIVITFGMLDFNDFCVTLAPFVTGGRFGYLLNSRSSVDLFASRFAVFEVDVVSKIPDIYPLWLLCIMHSFEDKMRRNRRRMKLMVIDEAWKAIANEQMAPYIAWLWRTARKFNTGAVVITQMLDDVISSPVIRDAIINNSDVKVLLDQSKSKNNFDDTQRLLGLSQHDKSLVLSVGRDLNPRYRYREAFVGYANGRSAVYAYEVSPEEAVVFESNKTAKQRFIDLSREKGAVEAVKTIIKERKA